MGSKSTGLALKVDGAITLSSLRGEFYRKTISLIAIQMGKRHDSRLHPFRRWSRLKKEARSPAEIGRTILKPT